MSCGGAMMRAPFQPLAHLVDAAAERWLEAQKLSPAERIEREREIAGTFNPGDRDELAFHGVRYILTARRSGPDTRFDVHKIAQPD